jgi:NTP pyrophosphatase (non-canonical NTP hydrolase)
MLMGRRNRPKSARLGLTTKEESTMLSSEDAFVLSFNSVSERINQWAITKGWNDKEVPMSESIALMHSELSEALEGDRHGNPPSDKIPEFSSVEEEFADVIIRIMHVAARNNIKVAEALVAKLEYNNNRSYKHGGKAY